MIEQNSNNKPFYLRLHKILWQVIIRPARFIWKCRRGIAIFLIAFAVLHTIAVIITGHMVNNELAKIKAKGEPVNVSELREPKVADNQNAYIYFKQAADKIHNDADLKRIEKEIFLSSRINQSYNDKLKDDIKLREKLKVWMNKNSEAFVLLQKAVSMPYYQDEAKWEDGYLARFTYFSKIRESQRIYCKKAYIEALDGNLESAISDTCTTLIMGNQLKKHPTLIGQIVRRSIDSFAIANAKRIADENKLSYANAVKLNNALKDIDYSDIFKTAMLGERTLNIWRYDYMKKNGMKNMGFDDYNDTNKNIYDFYLSYFCRPIYNLDKLRYLKTITYSIAHRPLLKETVCRECISLEPVKINTRYPISNSLEDDMHNTNNSLYVAGSNIAGTRVYLGLIAYKDKFGSYPNSLDELKTKLNWETPIDVCAGKAFTYKKKGSGFILYGYGPNGKDDNGLKRGIENNYSDNNDIVWEKDK